MRRVCIYWLCLVLIPLRASAGEWESIQAEFTRATETRLERRIAALEKIAEQMARHYIASKYPAAKPKPKMADDVPPKPVVIGYRTETRYRNVPYTVKMCQNGRCWFETRYQRQAYTVQVPVMGSPEAAPTPMSDVRRILQILNPQPGETFVDFGCGADARFVIEAVKRYGCKGLGIEIDAERAASAQKAVDASGLGNRIRIVHDDSTKLTIEADVGVAYLYPETLKALLPNIQRLKRFASYQHKVDGLPMWDYRQGVYVWQRPKPEVYRQQSRRYAVWGGYQYAGRLCSNPSCRMCNYIQRMLGY